MFGGLIGFLIVVIFAIAFQKISQAQKEKRDKEFEQEIPESEKDKNEYELNMHSDKYTLSADGIYRMRQLDKMLKSEIITLEEYNEKVEEIMSKYSTFN